MKLLNYTSNLYKQSTCFKAMLSFAFENIGIFNFLDIMSVWKLLSLCLSGIYDNFVLKWCSLYSIKKIHTSYCAMRLKNVTVVYLRLYIKCFIDWLYVNFNLSFMIQSVSIFNLSGLHSVKILLLYWLGCTILLGTMSSASTNLLIHKTIRSLLCSNQVRVKTSD